jgi:glycosyltransferase involved in cell wall biosynthesis
MEEALVQKADTIIAVGDTLRDKLARMGRTASLLTHGVDLEFWNPPCVNGALPELGRLERPLVVFWGIVDRRMDVAFVQHLASELTRGTIVLAGPEADPEPALLEVPRVVRLGTLPFQELPTLAHHAAVLVMPYADLPVTRAMQPLKLKEYLATGKPVVVRDLPSTREWADCLDRADNATAFSQAVRMGLAEGLPEEQRQARTRLHQESWRENARVFRDLLFGGGPLARAGQRPAAKP